MYAVAIDLPLDFLTPAVLEVLGLVIAGLSYLLTGARLARGFIRADRARQKNPDPTILRRVNEKDEAIAGAAIMAGWPLLLLCRSLACVGCAIGRGLTKITVPKEAKVSPHDPTTAAWLNESRPPHLQARASWVDKEGRVHETDCTTLAGEQLDKHGRRAIS